MVGQQKGHIIGSADFPVGHTRQQLLRAVAMAEGAESVADAIEEVLVDLCVFCASGRFCLAVSVGVCVSGAPSASARGSRQ